MTDDAGVVFILDPDPCCRHWTERLVLSRGWHAQAFDSGLDFLTQSRPEAPACVILEAFLPELSGLELQQELASRGNDIPLIFTAGHGDVAMSVQAMKAGAADFFTKPIQETDLLEAVRQAIERDRAGQERRRRLAGLRNHYDRLTPREREVMECVVSGLLNKQTAAALGTTEKTIKFHRGHIMHKMGAGSIAELVRMAGSLEVQNSCRARTGPRSSRSHRAQTVFYAGSQNP